MKKEQAVHQITEILEGFSVKDVVEILANVLIFKGVSGMKDTPSNVKAEQITPFVLKDRDKHGETIFNSLALQGLTMLIWVEETNKGEK